MEHRLAQSLGVEAAEDALPPLLNAALGGDVDKLLAGLAECRKAAGADTTDAGGRVRPGHQASGRDHGPPTQGPGRLLLPGWRHTTRCP